MKKSGRREKRKCHVAASRVPVRTAFLFALIVMTRQVCMYVNVRWVMELFTIVSKISSSFAQKS